MMTSRERLITVLGGGVPDRVPLCETIIWAPTFERWYKEGLPEEITDENYTDYFGLDRIGIVFLDGSFQFQREVIEETGEYRIEKDEFGATVKSWKNNYAPRSRIDYSVKSIDDWSAVKGRLQATEDRMGDNDNYKNFQEKDIFTVVSPVEPAWFILQHVLGFERTLTAMMEDEDLINDMLATCTDFIISQCQLCLKKGLNFDALWFFSDLCYKNGMFFSPQTYRKLVMPYHKKIAKFCKANQWPLILHCDGDVGEFVPLLIEAGFNCIQPLEARCGNDVRELKRLYGSEIVFFGNINTDVMSKGKREIEEELEAKMSVAKGGGYIYHSDHSIPPTVSLEQFEYTIESAKKWGRYYSVASDTRN